LIQVALDKTGDREVIASYRLGSLLVLLVGTTLGSLFASQIVRHAMRPVREIERTASRISTGFLGVRAGTGRWPKELSALAKAFDLMLDRIEDGYARLDRVSTEIAHELRSPIQIVLMQTEVALTKERSVDDLRQILESNIEEFQGLARMINGMLLLARANGPEAGLERRRLDVRKELEAICEFHEALAESLRVSVLCKGEGQLLADRTLFRRAVTNLLSNALRNTPRGGQVVLSVEQPESDTLIVKCSDTGCGIPPEKLPNIFDRGRDRASITDLGSQGNGLGLPIVKMITNLHGGTAAVESTSAQGTVVVLNFPAVRKPAG
jgi:two-component system heavy metal sensor histidine kinase CusS